MPNKAVFLDRDGTINTEVSFLANMSKIELITNAVDALKILQDNKYKLIIVTNQSGIARGYFTERRLKRINKCLLRMLNKKGIKIDGVFYCPYFEKGKLKRYRKKSNDRKPFPGMLVRASKIYNIDLKESFMIGDRGSDIGAGNNAGCKSILVKTGYGNNAVKNIDQWDNKPLFIAKDLYKAVEWIVQQ